MKTLTELFFVALGATAVLVLVYTTAALPVALLATHIFTALTF